METKNTFLAIMLSLLILLGYQYFFMPPPKPAGPVEQPAETASVQTPAEPLTSTEPSDAAPPPAIESAPSPSAAPPSRPAREVTVETSLYKAVLSEHGGGLKSFKLKKYRESVTPDSPPKELLFPETAADSSLLFGWGNGIADQLPLFEADTLDMTTTPGGEAVLTLRAEVAPGLALTRSYRFQDQNYSIDLTIAVENRSPSALQGSPILRLTNLPFGGTAEDRFVFHGPALFLNGSLEEVPVKDLQAGQKSLGGTIEWLAYEDAYFMAGIIPAATAGQTAGLHLLGASKVRADLKGGADILAPGGTKNYDYRLYFGPRELRLLKTAGANLDKGINFGWFDVLAKPTLYLLNFFNRFFHNYGVAIILVTVLFKLLFWPISHKGMKSMKTMQKIQPKLAKLREQCGDDRERLNQEMMNLYRTYKINPLGGCLPMLLQIPVFFALYKVLLQTIELRHAPFLLWINDLSAPDRLPVGFDIPFLGGIPVLTLLMGGSMFLQQKMTPSSADPAQARIMLFLPVIFTFMFLNFASGLVLYWFVNNLLSIAQQSVINRQAD